MGGYVGVLVLLGGGFVILFFGSSQYVKIYRIEGTALSKQVFDGGSLYPTVFSRKAFADGGSLDLTARWINFVEGKAFIVVRSSDLNRDLQLDKMNVLTVCTTGLYMDPARPDLGEQCASLRCASKLSNLSCWFSFSLCRSAHITLTLKRFLRISLTAMCQRGNFRAARASHSLHARSSQENQSCEKTIWRRKSSDQGNCRLQAPSTPQSVHVGSSQGKRTCKLGLYLPSLDQLMHVLYLGIQDVVEGRWEEFFSAWTSLETSLSNERKISISIFPCGSRNGAHAYSLAQDECKTDDTVKFHFLHGVNIVIKRAQADVHSWIDNKYAYWRQNGKHKSSWWDHIRDEFIQIFRNVMVCLCHIYSKRIYSDAILVINNRETKLILLVKAATEEEFNNGSRRDIIDLRQLMVEAVLKDYIASNAWGDGTKERAAKYFSEEGLPNDLCHFIGRLYDENFVPINLDWLLDDPAFWSPDLKLGFFRDLYEIVRDRQLMDTGHASAFLFEKLEELKITNWECLTHEWGRREIEVLHKMRQDQKLHNKEDRGSGGSRQSRFMGKGKGKVKVKEKNQEMGCGGSHLPKIKGKEKVEWKEKEKTSGSEGNKFTKREIFWDILHFCRHLIEHYNDKLPHHKRKEKEEISLIADKLFNGACSMLRNSILEAWMAQPSSSKTGRPEYMNMLMTKIVGKSRINCLGTYVMPLPMH